MRTNLEWEMLCSNLKTAVNEYRAAGLGGEIGKFRAARFRDALYAISPDVDQPANGYERSESRELLPQSKTYSDTEKKELITLISAIFNSGSTKLSGLITQHTGYRNKDDAELKALQDKYPIDVDAITKKTDELVTSLKDFSNVTKERMLCAIERYEALPKYKKNNSTEETTGQLRARNLQRIIEKFKNRLDEDDLLELTYLVILSSSTDLQNEICAEIGFRVGYIHDLINNPGSGYPYCVFNQLSRKDAEFILEQKSLTTREMLRQNTESGLWFNNAEHNVAWFLDAIEQAVLKYKEVKRDALGSARADNLCQMAKAIANRKDSNDEQKKIEMLMWICALVFKSGSTDLKKIMLNKMGLSENQLSALQNYHSIPNFLISKFSKQLNQLTPLPDLERFYAALINAVAAYQQSDLGGHEGKLRAQNANALLKHIVGNKDTSEVEKLYELVLVANTMLDIGANKKSTISMLDYLSVINIDEKALKNLKEYFGVTDWRIGYTLGKLLDGINDESMTISLPSQEIDPNRVDWDLLMKRLVRALNRSAESQCTRNSIAILDAMHASPLTDENKKDLTLLLSAIVMNASDLKTRVLLNVGLNKAQVNQLREKMEVSDEACQQCYSKLSDRTQSLDEGAKQNPHQFFASSAFLQCPHKQGWHVFKTEVCAIANNFIQSQSESSVEKTMAINLLAEIKDKGMYDPKNQRQLMLLATAVVLCAASPRLSRAILIADLTQEEKDQYENLQSKDVFIKNRKTLFAQIAKSCGINISECSNMMEKLKVDHVDYADTEMASMSNG